MRNVIAIAQRELNAYFSSPIGYVLIGFFALLFGYFFYVPLYYFQEQSMQAGMNPTQAMNINQMLAKDSVRNRLEGDGGLSYTEFSYSLLQANDFLHLFVNHGVELQAGGSDQWGNIVAGTDLIRQIGRAHV